MSIGSRDPVFLPYARQSIDENDIAAVTDVLRSHYLTTGPAAGRLEAALAARVGAAHATACSSGTAALHLALAALDIGPGDSVIVPSITFLATATAARMLGAEVVFADVDPDNGLMTSDALGAAFARAERRGQTVKAVLPVHLAGQCADLVAISRIAASHGAVLVEDGCHALGTYHACADGAAAPVGSCRFSRMTVFSFHAVKTVAGGEGGAVTTNDPDLKARLDRLRNHGVTRDRTLLQNRDLAEGPTGETNPWYYEMAELGWNYRLSDLHAALATSQLARLQHFAERRRTLVSLYDDCLATQCKSAQPIRRSRVSHPAWHLYPVLIDFDALELDRGTVMRTLAAAGIGTQVHYIPVHRQPYWHARDPDLVLAGADAYYRRTLSLPLYVDLAASDVRRVVAGLSLALAPCERRRAAG